MLNYFFKKSIKSFGDNITLNAISIGIISIIFIIFAMYLLIVNNLNNSFKGLTKDIRIYAYLKPSVDENSAKTLIKAIKNIPGITKVRYQEPAKALLQFKSLFDKVPKDFEAMPNPFPPSLEISLAGSKTINMLEELAQEIKKLPETTALVDELDYGSRWLDDAQSTFLALKRAGLIFLAILFSGLFMIVFNTMKLIFTARTKEIEVMKMLGAKHSFIMAPYLFETAFVGVLSSSTALLILYAFWIYIKAEILKISFLLSGIVFFSFWNLLIFVLIGTLIVVFSATLSINKFLKDIH